MGQQTNGLNHQMTELALEGIVLRMDGLFRVRKRKAKRLIVDILLDYRKQVAPYKAVLERDMNSSLLLHQLAAQVEQFTEKYKIPIYGMP